MDISVIDELVAEMGPSAGVDVDSPWGARSQPTHALRCPDCDAAMMHTSLFQIPVDYCPETKHGVWLDKDELQQVLARSEEADDAAPARPTSFTSLLADFFRS